MIKVNMETINKSKCKNCKYFNKSVKPFAYCEAIYEAIKSNIEIESMMSAPKIKDSIVNEEDPCLIFVALVYFLSK